jgi:hypothetical protein
MSRETVDRIAIGLIALAILACCVALASAQTWEMAPILGIIEHQQNGPRAVATADGPGHNETGDFAVPAINSSTSVNLIPENKRTVNEGDRGAEKDGIPSRLTAIGPPFRARGDCQRKTYVVARCDCGNVVALTIDSFTRATSRSCGCLRVDRIVETKTTHGIAGSPLYRLYYAMVRRCYGRDSHHFYLYGERGIRVCAEWLASRESFIDWCIANGYKIGLQIDRYEPGNCRFVTGQQNSQNRRGWTKKSSTRFKGIVKVSTGWSACVGHNGTKHYLGTFRTDEAAARAYDRKARELFGEFAHLNFPEERL